MINLTDLKQLCFIILNPADEGAIFDFKAYYNLSPKNLHTCGRKIQ